MNFPYIIIDRIAGSSGGPSEWVNFYEAKERNLGNSDKPDYFQCKAIIHLVKTTQCVYKSCSKPDCNKKVIDNDNGIYRCEKCQIDNHDFKYRLLVNVMKELPLILQFTNIIFDFHTIPTDEHW